MALNGLTNQKRLSHVKNFKFCPLELNPDSLNHFCLSADYCAFDHCARNYIAIDKEPMTWFQARAYCREFYTDLAFVDHAQDMNRVLEKMNENNLPSIWIGLYEDKFTWRWSLSHDGY